MTTENCRADALTVSHREITTSGGHVICHGEFGRLNVPGLPYDRTNSGSTK
ncbi:Uncharacterised protein [Burkholderia pseudomallei]|nr:Uncharacterised protein [Burkholderia pseudomallei]CAJ6708921.1 Uncharacterised protein [Burkholderia pseudomallei]